MVKRYITHELGLYNHIITVRCDNQSTIHLAKNYVYHERSKHINIRLHFIIDIIFVAEVKGKKVQLEITHLIC